MNDDERRMFEALTHAIEAQSKSSLALIDELTQSRAIQQHMANTLVEIHTGQQQIIEQISHGRERTNDLSKRAGDSEGKIRVLTSRLDRYEERLQSVEKKRA